MWQHFLRILTQECVLSHLTVIYRELSRLKWICGIAQRAIDGLSIIVDYVRRRPP